MNSISGCIVVFFGTAAEPNRHHFVQSARCIPLSNLSYIDLKFSRSSNSKRIQVCVVEISRSSIWCGLKEYDYCSREISHANAMFVRNSTYGSMCHHSIRFNIILSIRQHTNPTTPVLALFATAIKDDISTRFRNFGKII